jgi:hypothetical protein
MYTTTTTTTTTTTATTNAAVGSNSTSSNNTLVIIIIIVVISAAFRTATGSYGSGYLLQNYFLYITKINKYLTVYCNGLLNEIILGVLS